MTTAKDEEMGAKAGEPGVRGTQAQTQEGSQKKPLRQRQQELTRLSILGAAEELIREGRLHNFTIQEVATRAGVSHRTVYLHFDSREALLDGLVAWAIEQTSTDQPPYPERLRDLPAWVEKVVPSLIEYLSTARALYAVLQARYDQDVPAPSRKRDEVFERLVAQAAPNLDPNVRKASVAGLRLWVSLRTLIELNVRHGLERDELTLAVMLGVRAQIELIEREAAGAKTAKRGSGV
jgi:AcrR family transcriptional regulator